MVFLLCARLLFTLHFSLALCLNSSKIFTDFWQEVNYFQFFVPPCGFKLKKLLQLSFVWFKKCALHFHTSVGSSLCLFSYGQVRRKNHVLVSKFEQFDHPLADALDLNYFLRMLVYVIARKHKCRIFSGKSFQLGFLIFFFVSFPVLNIF